MLEQCCKYSKQCRNNVATLRCAKNRRCESYRVASPFKTSRSTKGNPDSGIGETFASRIWNLGNLTLCNPESKSRIRNPTNDRIRKPSFTEKESEIQSLESGLQSVESKFSSLIWGRDFMRQTRPIPRASRNSSCSRFKTCRPTVHLETCLKRLTFHEE